MGVFQDQLFSEMAVRRFSRNSKKAYRLAMRAFVKFCGKKSPDVLGLEDIRRYQLHMVTVGKSAATVNQHMCAIRFFYREVLRVAWKMDELPYFKLGERLPIVFSRAEVARLLSVVANLKHRAILTLLYATGMRLGEALALAIPDIDSERNVLAIRQAKGLKDRHVMLSPALLTVLREYWRAYQPPKKGLLFLGGKGKEQLGLGSTSIQRIFHKARVKAGIKKRATVHTLRHTFATHMLEAGVNIVVIQRLLGHRSLKTTQIYLHLASNYVNEARSPLEDLPSVLPKVGPEAELELQN